MDKPSHSDTGENINAAHQITFFFFLITARCLGFDYATEPHITFSDIVRINKEVTGQLALSTLLYTRQH